MMKIIILAVALITVAATMNPSSRHVHSHEFSFADDRFFSSLKVALYFGWKDNGVLSSTALPLLARPKSFSPKYLPWLDKSREKNSSVPKVASKTKTDISVFKRQLNTSEEAQPRDTRQTLKYQKFYRQRCSSPFVNAYLNMVPPVASDRYEFRGGYRVSKNHSDLFVIHRYSHDIVNLVNINANRSLCVNSTTGDLYSAPLQYYTHTISHECLFRRVSVSGRTWCQRQSGLSGNVYVTTVGRPRALAMTTRGRGTYTDVITISWTESEGPEQGCAPPKSGCYTWRSLVKFNCGINNNNCRTRRTTTELPHSCAVRYCSQRAEYRRKENIPMSPSEVHQCIDDMLQKISIMGEKLHRNICNHTGFKEKFLSVMRSEEETLSLD